MEVDREIEVEKNDEKKERLKEENHVSYMQTDIRMTILFYRNAILLKCLRKKRDKESTTVYSMRNISGFRNVRNFLIVQSLCRSSLRGTDNDAERIR